MFLRAFVWGIVNNIFQKIFLVCGQRCLGNSEIKLSTFFFFFPGRTSQGLNKAYLQQLSPRGASSLQHFPSLIDLRPLVQVPSQGWCWEMWLWVGVLCTCLLVRAGAFQLQNTENPTGKKKDFLGVYFCKVQRDQFQTWLTQDSSTVITTDLLPLWALLSSFSSGFPPLGPKQIWSHSAKFRSQTQELEHISFSSSAAQGLELTLIGPAGVTSLCLTNGSLGNGLIWLVRPESCAPTMGLGNRVSLVWTA